MLSYEKETRNLGTVRLVGGESLVSAPVQFSKDSRHFFCCGGNKIYVYSTETGDLLRELDEHNSKITGFSVNSKNEFQLASCCTDGHLIVWDYTDGAILKRFKFDLPLQGVYLHPYHENSVFLVKVIVKGKTKKNKLTQVDLREDNLHGENLLTFSGLPLLCAFSRKGVYIAYLHSKRQKLCLMNIKKKESNSFAYKDSTFNCLAFHPFELCVAAGDQFGRIILWKGLHDKTPVTMELHWHAHAVSSLSFTYDGSYIMSGGQEAVLVLWQYASDTKQFLPRMGAPIAHVCSSHDDMVIAVSHEDNVIKLVSGIDLSIKHTISGLLKGKCMRKELVFDPRSGALVMNSMPGVLQFYDPYSKKGKFLVNVVKQNYVSQTEDEELFFTDVQHVAFSAAGDWMATVEYRNDNYTSEETTLKFWEFNPKTQCYSINTIIDTPHNHQTVAVRFQPITEQSDEPLLAVTAGHDGRFKIWVLNEKQSVTERSSCWSCNLVGYYNDTPCLGAVFSEDGQVLAVPYEQVITLWTPNNNVLQKTLHVPLPDEKIRFVTFGCQSSSHYLVVATTHYLFVWNLLSCTVLWSVEAKVDYMVPDPNTKCIAVFVQFNKSTHLYLFDPSSPSPVAVHALNSKSLVHAAAFDPKVISPVADQDKSLNLSTLFFLDNSQQLFTLIDEQEQKHEQPAHVQTAADSNISAEQDFLNVFGKPMQHEQGSLQPVAKVVHGNPASVAVREMLSIPAHVLPPVSTLCSAFLKSLLVSKEIKGHDDQQMANKKYDGSDDDMNNESDSEPESESVDHVTAKIPDISEEESLLLTTDLDMKELEKVDYDWLKEVFVSLDK